MPQVMLRPNWAAGHFNRTVSLGDPKSPEKKLLTFNKSTPTEVTDDEFLALLPDIGKALFEVERDEKSRIRYVESDVEAAAVPTDPPAPPSTDEAKGEGKKKKAKE